MKTKRLLGALLSLVVLVRAHAGASPIFTWQGFGGTNSDWSTANNWAGGVAPTTDGSATVLLPNFTSSFLNIDSNQSINSLIFQTDQFYSLFASNTSGVVTLTIGAGGLSYSSVTSGQFTDSEILSLRLNSESASGLKIVTDTDQTWAINQGRLTVNTDVGGTGRITKTGDGELRLFGLNGTLTGGVTLQQGTLSISGSSALGSGEFIIGPALSAGAVSPTIRADSNNGGNGATITNATTINGLLSVKDSDNLQFTGAVTLASPTTNVEIQGADVEISGAISGSSSIVMNSFGSLILSGNNTYTGGTTVQNGILVFATAGAIPSTGLLSARSTLGGTNLSHGYIGFGDDGTANGGAALSNPQGLFLDHFDKANTNGTVGFDTDPNHATANNYTGAIDMTGFDVNAEGGAHARLGSATTTNNGTGPGAILSGTITFPGSTYYFGGGGGMLQVNSQLSNSFLDVTSPSETPLTLRLTNTSNNFNGSVSIGNSAVIFSAGALPAGTTNILIGSGGYFGTESANTGNTATDDSDIASFLGHVNAGANSMIGFDSAPGTQRTLSRDINLGGIASPVFLGTATSNAIGLADLSLDGTITTTNGGTDSYRFAGYKGGTVSVNSLLTGARGVVIGNPEVQATFGDFSIERISTVGLFNNGNNYSGGTTFGAGRLLVGGGPNATTNVLGTGALTIAATTLFTGQQHDDGPVVLESADNNLTIANAIVLNRDLQVGGLNALTLSGNITGIGALRFELMQDVNSATTLNYTLGGNNSFSGGLSLSANQNVTTNLTIASDTGAGLGAINTNNSGGSGTINLNFTSAAPVIGGLESFDSGLNISLANNSALTINQSTQSNFDGSISGSGAKLVKSGAGLLQLGGNNTYSGGTDILNGALFLQSNTAVGSGTITLNGANAKLLAGSNSPLTNPLVLTQGTIGGFGTFAPSNGTVTIGSGLTLSPGIDEFGGVGFTTFAVGLTLASGGNYRWDIRDTSPGGPGSQPGFDGLLANAGLDLTATSIAPFLITLSSPDNSAFIANFSSSSPFSLNLLNSASPITGFTGSDQFIVDASFFTSITNGGLFSVSLGGTNNNSALLLNFTPLNVPEPSTYALLALGLGVIALPLLRRRCG